MLVRLPQSLVIAEYFNYDRFGEIVLAQPLAARPGRSRARRSTRRAPRPTRERCEQPQPDHARRRPERAEPARAAPSRTASRSRLGNRFRGGDIVDEHGRRARASTSASTGSTRPRAPTTRRSTRDRPRRRRSAARYASRRRTRSTSSSRSIRRPATRARAVRRRRNLDCRGADADQPLEFQRQRDKLLAALSGLNADIIGLNEIENTTECRAARDPTRGIVSGLAAGVRYITPGLIGTDAIKVGLDLQARDGDAGRRVRDPDLGGRPRFIDTRTGPALAQTFQVNATGERFTVAVNHLKSKGSDCNDVGDPDTGDGQGNCNLTRTDAAQGARRLARDRPDRQRRPRLPDHRRPQLVRQGGPDRRDQGRPDDGWHRRLIEPDRRPGRTPTRTCSTARPAISTTRWRTPACRPDHAAPRNGTSTPTSRRPRLRHDVQASRRGGPVRAERPTARRITTRSCVGLDLVGPPTTISMTRRRQPEHDSRYRLRHASCPDGLGLGKPTGSGCDGHLRRTGVGRFGLDRRGRPVHDGRQWQPDRDRPRQYRRGQPTNSVSPPVVHRPTSVDQQPAVLRPRSRSTPATTRARSSAPTSRPGRPDRLRRYGNPFPERTSPSLDQRRAPRRRLSRPRPYTTDSNGNLMSLLTPIRPPALGLVATAGRRPQHST